MAKKRRRRSSRGPALGRNLALRPGGGTHRPAQEKRAADRERREIDEQREERPSDG